MSSTSSNRGRGGGLAGTNTRQNFNKNHRHVDFESNHPVYCFYCPPLKSAMTQRSLANATICAMCNQAFHPGCIKRTKVNSDGSVSACCGGDFQDCSQSLANKLPQ